MSTKPYDEKNILADDRIIRRINPVQHVIRDDNRGCERISSKAFKPSSGENSGMSVDIEASIIAAGYNPQQWVTTPIFTGSVYFLAHAVRALNLWVGYDPVPRNPHHGEVWGNSSPSRFTGTQRKGLHKAAEWYVPLNGVEIR